MTSETPCNPSDVALQEVSRNAIKEPPMIKRETFNMNDRFKYREDVSSDDILLNEISSSLTGIEPSPTYDIETDDIPRIRTYVSHKRHHKISADRIAEVLCIGPDKAAQMLRVTRQRGTRSAILPIGRRYRAD